MRKQNQAGVIENETEGISIIELIRRLWRGKLVILIAIIICLLVASIYSFFYRERFIY